MPIIMGMIPYSREDAEESARLNNEADEDGWSYTAVCINERRDYWQIAVRDETGELLGYL